MEKERNTEIIPPVEIVSFDTLNPLERAELGLPEDESLEELTDVEKAESLADRLIFKQITKERQQEQLKLHGKTDQQLETDADQLLKSMGFDKDGNPV